MKIAECCTLLISNCNPIIRGLADTSKQIPEESGWNLTSKNGQISQFSPQGFFALTVIVWTMARWFVKETAHLYDHNNVPDIIQLKSSEDALQSRLTGHAGADFYAMDAFIKAVSVS